MYFIIKWERNIGGTLTSTLFKYVIYDFHPPQKIGKFYFPIWLFVAVD